MKTISVGTRVGYTGNDYIQLGTVKALHPDLDEGESKAFSVTWDDGFDDEGYWSTDDTQIKRVR